MAKTSIAQAIVAWESALTNAKTGATEVPGIEGYTASLEQILAEAKALTARLDMRNGVKQQETLDRKNLMAKGNVEVSRLRSAIRAYFGPRSERLIDFGARPVRPRARKKSTEQAVPPQVPPAGGSAPDATPVVKPDTGTAESQPQ